MEAELGELRPDALSGRERFTETAFKASSWEFAAGFPMVFGASSGLSGSASATSDDGPVALTFDINSLPSHELRGANNCGSPHAGEPDGALVIDCAVPKGSSVLPEGSSTAPFAVNALTFPSTGSSGRVFGTADDAGLAIVVTELSPAGESTSSPAPVIESISGEDFASERPEGAVSVGVGSPDVLENAVGTGRVLACIVGS
jgi:hypothetical protein